MQATGRQPQRAPGGAPLDSERHHPLRAAPYRLGRQHPASFIAHTEASTGSEPVRFVRDRLDATPAIGIAGVDSTVGSTPMFLHHRRCSKSRVL